MDDYKEQEKLHYNMRYKDKETFIRDEVNIYDMVNENAVRYFYAHVKSIIKDKGQISILDYGCGDGDKSIPLVSKDIMLTGIDISDKSIDQAQVKYSQHKNVSFEVMDCEKTTFKDDTFDMIFDYGTFSNIDISTAIHEIHRILKPDGVLVCIETLGHNPIINLKRRISAWRGKRTQWASSHIMKIKNWVEIQNMFESNQIKHFNILSILFAPIMRFLPSKLSYHILDYLWSIDSKLVNNEAIAKYAFKTVAVFRELK